MKYVSFFFKKCTGTDTRYRLDIYKDNVLGESWQVADSNELQVSVEDLMSDTTGEHTIKLKVVADVYPEPADQTDLISTELVRIEADGVVHSDADDILSDIIKVYNILTPELSALIASGEVESDGTETVDLGLGDGEQTYSYAQPWKNNGLAHLNSVYVMTFDAPFETWYNANCVG
jgi:hypothetical protein